MTLLEAYQKLDLPFNSTLEEAYQKYCGLMFELGFVDSLKNNQLFSDQSREQANQWEQAYGTIYEYFNKQRQLGQYISYYLSRPIANSWEDIQNNSNDFCTRFIDNNWKDIQNNSNEYDPVFITYFKDLIKNINEAFIEFYQNGRISDCQNNLKHSIEDSFRKFIVCFCESNSLPYAALTLTNNTKIIIVMGVPFCIDVNSLDNENGMTLYQIYQQLKKIYDFMGQLDGIFLKHLGARIPLRQFLNCCISKYKSEDITEMSMYVGDNENLNPDPDLSSLLLDENMDFDYYLNCMFESFADLFLSFIESAINETTFLTDTEDRLNDIKIDFIRMFGEMYSLSIGTTNGESVMVESTSLPYTTISLINLKKSLETIYESDTPIDRISEMIIDNFNKVKTKLLTRGEKKKD